MQQAKRKTWPVAMMASIAVLVAGGIAAVSITGYMQRSAAPTSTIQENPSGLKEIPLSNAVVFRDTRDFQDYGKVGWVELADLPGTRTMTSLSCDRVYRTGGMLSCLSVNRGMNTTYDSQVYSVGGQLLATGSLPGEPSRTRVSPTGMVGVTSFITGESYEQVGFSTKTTISAPGGKDYGNLQDFTLLVDGKTLTAEDRNVWGVSFAKDANTFYATAASGKQTWLMRGSLSDRTLTAVSENAECPSISPNGKFIAYKKKRADSVPVHWDIAVQDLSQGTETLYPLETSFDDQLEWLDSETLLFGQARADSPGDADIFSLTLQNDSKPRLFLEHAFSPSIQR
ncbi:hypothetical protein CQ018_13535 [Arthrobacter sp. MYb227]|uniref:hypothetical protein n=1 Tax=Arthrobacter sp. MYb227 TaxID=1848601 RepID=UPI000CFD117A|nr:hypothetical protein [Arthrobacter sp. MYb227]PQZ91651.1 hypothetical protein CQ018_13535 [Arthrobacter sp. MYb227]